MEYQKTIQSPVSVTGVGVHSGLDITLTLHPADSDTGIVFVRTDINTGDNIIPALWNRVVDTRMCTVIANDSGASVGTIEHLMAALRGCGIDNCRADITGAEVPIMDGSAKPFVDMIENAGISTQNAPLRKIRVLKPVRVEKDDKVVTLSPSDSASFSGGIDFAHPVIGAQDYTTQLVNGTFKHDIAKARTFGFYEQVEMLRANGLALGGSLDNAIVLNHDGVMNPGGLRFQDEFIRHKILDAIGDLYLAGAPIIGQYDGQKAGHEMNNLILHALFSDEENWQYDDNSTFQDHNTLAVIPTSKTSAAR